MKKNADISPCEKYRYALLREWDPSLKEVMFLMLNPSTADANIDDNTIRRCIDFAKRWGYGSIVVGNYFAYRSTDPNKLLEANNPIGEDNELVLKRLFDCVDEIVCAWGNPSTISRLSKLYPNYNPLSLADPTKLRFLELGKTGTPKHPLYLPSTTTLKIYNL